MKSLLILATFCLSFTSFSQNGYVQQTIIDGDTTSKFMPGQIYWKLQQGVDDLILESKMNGSKVNIQYPVVSRDFNGYVKEYVVDNKDLGNFTIRFHSRQNRFLHLCRQNDFISRGEHKVQTLIALLLNTLDLSVSRPCEPMSN